MQQHTPGIHEQLGRMRQAALLDQAHADQLAALARPRRRSLRVVAGRLAARRSRRQTVPTGAATPIAR
jgi:hypothetical protein